MIEKSEVKIFVDQREAGSRIATILSKYCEIEEKQLPVADYLLSKRIAVERKTSSDFLSSMIDGRLFKQMTELKENFKMPLLIIEGNGLFNGDRNIHPNAIRGALASISLDYGIPILRTENNLETAEMLLAIAKREQLKLGKKNAVRGRKWKRSPNEVQEFVLSGLPKINRMKAKALLKHFGSPQAVFMASREDLMQVEGIGPKLARRIRLILTRKYEKSILED